MTIETTADPRERHRLGDGPENLDDILSGFRDGPQHFISLAQAANLFPPSRNGKKAHVATILRYGKDGVPAWNPLFDGERFYLHLFARPGGWMTSKEAVAEFINELTNDRLGRRGPAPAAPRTSAVASRAAARADAELAAAGF